jgi:hypothetical protein
MPRLVNGAFGKTGSCLAFRKPYVALEIDEYPPSG